MTRRERRAIQATHLQRLEEIESKQLADLEMRRATFIKQRWTWEQAEPKLSSWLIGLRTRSEERRNRLAAIDALDHAAEIATARLVAGMQRIAPWSGTAAGLLTLLPGLAPDPIRLSRLVAQAAPSLVAAGVTVIRRRLPGTGQRLLVLKAASA